MVKTQSPVCQLWKLKSAALQLHDLGMHLEAVLVCIPSN